MKNLTLLRKQKGISQNKLGLEVGLANNTICQYESGRRVPDVSTLSSALSVSTDYLLDRQSPEESPLTETKQSLIEKIKSLPDEQATVVLGIVEHLK